ncbi:MAG: peptide chain release factor N(5)-glutamine methyltransferase [Desulfobacterales bacterium]|nr:peptide chain release factor N(5)-glutamine methyltransferase [Desulfobacterales bacterium]
MQNQKTDRDRWIILDLVKWATSYFKSHNIENPRASAELLLAHTLKLRRIDLYLQYDQPLEKPELAAFKSFIKRRVNKEPDAYILGVKEFWSMALTVTPDVLIPRPETEFLVEKILETFKSNYGNEPLNILDLGTGSGAITIALASECPANVFFASDKSVRALGIAKKNAMQHVPDRNINFLCGNWLDSFKQPGAQFDIIISNPPYIESGIISGLEPEVCKYEPHTALDGGEDGLDDIRKIIESAHLFLKPGGWLFLEMGFDQQPGVSKIVAAVGRYDHLNFSKDYSGHDRVVEMRKNKG